MHSDDTTTAPNGPDSRRGPLTACRVGLGRLLCWRGLPAVAALLAVVLALPSLGAGWQIDDLVHRSFLLDGIRSPLDLFGFLSGDVEYNRALMSDGRLPWWTLEGLRISFCRPLTSLTMWLDYSLWPDSAALMHAHSLAWFGACVLVAGLLYRRFLGPTWVAGLAALLFAVDDAHATPATWLANRNVLPAFAFGGLALLAHDHWRRHGWRAGRWIGPLLLLASMCSAEAGVATMAYLIAHALFLEDDTWRRRVACLAPYFVIAVGWRLVYGWLGYGTWGSGFYTDPGSEPLHFVGVALQRAPLLLLAQWGLPPSPFDGLMAMYGPNAMWIVSAWAFVVVLGLILTTVVRTSAVSRMWCCGMLLSLPPVCATLPMGRLLFFIGLGAFGLLAQLIEVLWGHAPGHHSPSSLWRRAAMVSSILLLLIHGLAAPLALPLMTRYVVPPEVAEQIFINEPMDAAIEHDTLIVVNAPSVFHARHTRLLRSLQGQPVPRSMRFLSPSAAAVTLTRPDVHTLVLRADGGYLRAPLDTLFRGAHMPMPVGTRVQLPGLDVEVIELTPDGRPSRVSFSFDVPLEDPALRFMRWQDGAFEWFSPPAVGSTVHLPAPQVHMRRPDSD